MDKISDAIIKLLENKGFNSEEQTYFDILNWLKSKGILVSITCDYYVNSDEPWFRAAVCSKTIDWKYTPTCSSYEEVLSQAFYKAVELL